MPSHPTDLSPSEAQHFMSQLLDGELSPDDADRLHAFLNGNPEAMDWMESNQLIHDSENATPIIDVTGAQEKTLRGQVPPRSVVIPGTRTKHFPAGDFNLPCALIVGQRKASTDRKTSLNSALREHGLGA